MKSYVTKRTIFDSTVFAYLAMIFIYSSYAIGDYFRGVIRPTLSEDYLVANMSSIALITLFMAIAGGALSYLVNKSGRRTLGEVIFQPDHLKAQAAEISWYKTFWGWQLLITFVVTCIAGAYQTDFSIYELTDEAGFAGARRLFAGLAQPNFEVLPLAIIKIIETIFIAFMATAIAIPVAFLMSFVCAKNIMTHPLAFAAYGILRTILNVTRSVEPLIWAIIFSVWVGIGPFAGMLALMLHSVASLAKQYSELVESVSEGPIEGIRSTGAGSIQTIWFAIVPQVMLPYIAFTIYRWDINVRMATIIGLVGGGGIGTMLIKYQGQAMWAEVGCIILVIAVIVWLMDTASAYIREAIK